MEIVSSTNREIEKSSIRFYHIIRRNNWFTLSISAYYQNHANAVKNWTSISKIMALAHMVIDMHMVKDLKMPI